MRYRSMRYPLLILLFVLLPMGIVFSWDGVNPDALNSNALYPNVTNKDLVGTELMNTDLMNKNFMNTELMNKSFMSTELMNTDLMNTDLMNKNFMSADFVKPIRVDYANSVVYGLQKSTPGMSSTGFSETARAPSQLGAMLRSFVIPGWGHYYVNPDSWRRGQLHLGAEVVLIASYLGISRQSYVLEKNMYTHATAFSGADIRAQGREFELAVGNYRSLSEYNDFQERTRNLDRLLPDEPQFRWEWESDALRREYLDLRGRRDDLDQQLPALAALMVVNRVISGIGAYSRAGAYAAGQASVHVTPGPDGNGFRTVVSIPF